MPEGDHFNLLEVGEPEPLAALGAVGHLRDDALAAALAHHVQVVAVVCPEILIIKDYFYCPHGNKAPKLCDVHNNCTK